MTLLLALWPAAALAGDTWSTIRPGVDYLHRTTSDPEDIHAVRIDLTVPNVGLHASADSEGVERHVTTPTFAANAQTLIAINGDWSDSDTPVGMAISDGWLWHSHIQDDSLGGTWGFFACTATKDCTISSELPLDQAWWFGSPTISPYRYFQSVGANGQLMLVDGVSQSGCYDSAQNPRSAVCLDQTGNMLWLIVVDGRSSSSDGMTCDQMRQFMQEIDCWDGAMLDGGGSSTLVIDGDVVNTPSDGSPRTVSNHFGITYADSLDPACEVASGRWCNGTLLATCQGGRYLGAGDCAAYGASCEEDGDYAYCVDYRCPGGSGSGVACIDGTHFAGCTDGMYGEGDCGAFGLLCGTDASGSGCMDPRCTGPNSGVCTDASHYAGCAGGVYGEVDCGASGLTCDPTAGCVAPADTGDGGGGSGGNGGNGSGDDGGTGTTDSGTGGAGDGPGSATVGGGAGCGCSAGALGSEGAVGVSGLIVGVALMTGRRRRG